MTEHEIGSCEDALKLLAAYLDGELDSVSGEALDRHLSICRSCYSRTEFERQLKARFQGLRAESPPSRLRDRVRAVIDRFDVGPGG